MTGKNTWSYCPYRPFLREVGDIYVCRIEPSENKIHAEWLPTEDGQYSVFYKKRNDSEFTHWGDTCDTFCDIEGLDGETDYEFYVAAKEKKSRVRLARCARTVGTVVNYLHPEDEAYAFSGRYLCSPSLVRHPDGYLLASMDLYASGHPQNLTLIYRSDDNGASWHYLSELMPCFWGKMFIHKGELYMLACSTEYGDLLIGKSTDGGRSFSAPVCLLRGSNGKSGNTGVHKNPQNVIYHNGRIYITAEWGAWANKVFGHAAMMISADENADLLLPESWSFTEPMKFEAWTEELSDLPCNVMMIEGTPVVAPDGSLKDIMRFGKYHRALVLSVDPSDPSAPLCFDRLMEFPGNLSKFMIKKDDATGCYYSIATMAYDEENMYSRHLLSLVRSGDLNSWEVVCDLFDYRHMPKSDVGFQYVDFEFEGEDIIFLCRTALNGAHNFHDSNYTTFHKIQNFRTNPTLC